MLVGIQLSYSRRDRREKTKQRVLSLLKTSLKVDYKNLFIVTGKKFIDEYIKHFNNTESIQNTNRNLIVDLCVLGKYILLLNML